MEAKYYFDTKTFKMVTGVKDRSMVSATSSALPVQMIYDGSTEANDAVVDTSYFKNDPKPVAQTGTKTIKNYLRVHCSRLDRHFISAAAGMIPR